MKKKKQSDTELSYTKQLKKQREEKEFWGRFGFSDPNDAPTHINHLDLRYSTITDDQLALLVGRIRSVEMFDLNGTEITNEGISQLCKLEYLAELRLKECMAIDNGCVTSLKQLKTLKFLYLKSTPVTIDGLLGLTDMEQLEELFFSATEEEITEEKMVKLAALLPFTKLIINGKEYR